MLIPYTAENFEIYNSYVTIEYADEYFSKQFGENWSSFTDTAIKERLLVSASSLIDNEKLSDSKFDAGQNMEFPRGDGIIPMPIKYATCELAVLIHENDGIHFERSPEKVSFQGAVTIENEDNRPYNKVIRALLLPFVERRVSLERG
jgi:hypothetical protein